MKACCCYLNFDVFEELVVEGVGAVELEYDVAGEDVLDALDDVLRLRLCQLHRLARLEERPALGDLRDGGQLLHEHVVSGRRRLGVCLLRNQ